MHQPLLHIRSVCQKAGSGVPPFLLRMCIRTVFNFNNTPQHIPKCYTHYHKEHGTGALPQHILMALINDL